LLKYIPGWFSEALAGGVLGVALVARILPSNASKACPEAGPMEVVSPNHLGGEITPLLNRFFPYNPFKEAAHSCINFPNYHFARKFFLIFLSLQK